MNGKVITNYVNDFLALEPICGMHSSGSKIFSDGTIIHTIFLDNYNNPFISIKRELVNHIIQITEQKGILYVDVFYKNDEQSYHKIDYYNLIKSFSYDPINSSSEIPLLYKTICHSICNTTNKQIPSIETITMSDNSNNVLTFKELVSLEKSQKARKVIKVRSGTNVIALDTNNYRDITSLEDAVLNHLNKIVC